VHTAALKIVPAGEYNPMEFIKTNILGVQNLIDVVVGDSGRHYAKILALSTDKAVNPINLYGATKLCMEKLLLAANNIVGDRNIHFSVCRYGNVANSNGSIIPKFYKQVHNDEPLTITDKRMTRFWIELNEAAEFVYNSLNKMHGGEVFIPDMPSFKVTDLARAFCELFGDKIVEEVGIRDGEKLHEQIDEYRFSDKNSTFLGVAQLKDKLIEMGLA
jgi:UDP-N-acetylglucosamine 4,6-dehydratase